MGRSSSAAKLLAVFALGAAVATVVPTASIAQDYGDPGATEGSGQPGGGPFPAGPNPLPPPFLLPPPPCIHPIIIQVGRGLAHPARTKVIYGARPACG